MSKTVTRYAPSPTGNPHVGNIRSALFNFLYAKSKKGKFLLRIEDTDRVRFVPESVKYIEESLVWLGIEYDEEMIYQSKRLKAYKEHAEKLVGEKKAYKCFCSPERLEKLRNEQAKKKLPPAYDGKCRDLSEEELKKNEGKPYVIRFMMPKEGVAKWNDLVRGEVRIEYGTQDDPVIIKSDGWPTYNFANVIDDHDMGITDVIRGEEFIPSTPKHIAMYEALGWSIPNFAHLPLILGPDKSKLAKRHGDTAILDYKEKGYLPEAMVNFLSFLGWNPGTEDEVFSIEKLIKEFNMSKVQKSPAVFNIEKLNWYNKQHIHKLTDKELTEKLKEYAKGKPITKLSNFEKIVSVEKSRLTTLSDILSDTDYYISAPKYDAKILVFRKSTKEKTKEGMEKALETLESLKKWEPADAIEKALEDTVVKSNLTNGDVFWPVRAALSGKEKSPSPAELLWVLGKEESLKRIKRAIQAVK